MAMSWVHDPDFFQWWNADRVFLQNQPGITAMIDALIPETRQAYVCYAGQRKLESWNNLSLVAINNIKSQTGLRQWPVLVKPRWCWSCHTTLHFDDTRCQNCGGILCDCGACFCNTRWHHAG